MKKPESIQKLREAFDALEAAIDTFPAEHFFQRPPNDKWSVAENVEHLFLSVKPLVGLFGKKEMMLSNWGESNHSSLTYDALVEKYLGSIAQLTGTFGPVAPQKDNPLSREELLQNIHSIHLKFIERAESLTEEDLDKYQVPHPLLGLLTCREFLYFTAYHTTHHHKAIAAISL